MAPSFDFSIIHWLHQVSGAYRKIAHAFSRSGCDRLKNWDRNFRLSVEKWQCMCYTHVSYDVVANVNVCKKEYFL